MNAVVTPIAVAIFIVALDGSSRCQNPDIGLCVSGIIVEQADWYRNPLPPCNRSVSTKKCCPAANILRRDSSWLRDSRILCVNPVDLEFVYRMTVRNVGDKAVLAVEWEYLFIDAATNAEVGRRQFASRETIRPHQRKTLVESSSSPPMNVITVTSLSQPQSRRFIEEVFIRAVQFEDGSIWRPLCSHDQQ
jgi:hypothetical protein